MARTHIRGLALRTTCLAALLLLSAGCHYPRPVPTYEYLTDYERMSDRYDPLVSLVYAPEPTALGNYSGMIVGPITVGSGWVNDREDALHYATYLRVCLKKELNELRRFGFVAFEPDDLPVGGSEGALRLEGMVTKFEMGSGFLRYLSGALFFVQAGATDLQFEGRIVEADTGRLIMELCDRRRHHCNTPFGPNPKNFLSGYAMAITARETAACLARLVGLSYEGVPDGLPEQEEQQDQKQGTSLAAREGQ